MSDKMLNQGKEVFEKTLKETFKEFLGNYNLEELYWFKEVLEKEIRLGETAKSEGFEN